MAYEINLDDFRALRSFLKSPVKYIKQELKRIIKTDFSNLFTYMPSIFSKQAAIESAPAPARSPVTPLDARTASGPTISESVSPEINAPRPLTYSERRDAERAAVREEIAAETDAAAREWATQAKSTADALRRAANALGPSASEIRVAAAEPSQDWIGGLLKEAEAISPDAELHHAPWITHALKEAAKLKAGDDKPATGETDDAGLARKTEPSAAERLKATLRELDAEVPKPSAARVSKVRPYDGLSGLSASEHLAAELKELDAELQAERPTGHGHNRGRPRDFGRS